MELQHWNICSNTTSSYNTSQWNPYVLYINKYQSFYHTIVENTCLRRTVVNQLGKIQIVHKPSIQPKYMYNEDPLNPFKRKKNEFKILIFERLNTLHDNNPQEYWSLVKDLKEDKCDDGHSKKITKKWTQYFSNLFIV
ncbi:hypothetical protein MAR_024341 [Mya arenaria]|uniref:Uncharacterized protein n=1 Tax=Mya arenaria TaxID=6604 RepID=A0ABY7DSV2_MYAAR|nr:hypothetical protein MAR_024341 [Mya arenaria]